MSTLISIEKKLDRLVQQVTRLQAQHELYRETQLDILRKIESREGDLSPKKIAAAASTVATAAATAIVSLVSMTHGQ